MTDKEEIHHTALKSVYKVLRDKFNWVLILFVWLSYWSVGLCVCVCECVYAWVCFQILHACVNVASVLCVDRMYIHTCVYSLLYCTYAWSTASERVWFGREREREMSLDVHVTLAMKQKKVYNFVKKNNKKNELTKWWLAELQLVPMVEAEEEVLLKF